MDMDCITVGKSHSFLSLSFPTVEIDHRVVVKIQSDNV